MRVGKSTVGIQTLHISFFRVVMTSPLRGFACVRIRRDGLNLVTTKPAAKKLEVYSLTAECRPWNRAHRASKSFLKTQMSGRFI